jgi:hypothetical protein
MRPRFTWLCGALTSLALLSTAGCTALAVRLGLRVRLDHKPVTAVTASLKDERGGSAVGAVEPVAALW